MGISLYDTTIKTYQQLTGALGLVLEKAEAYRLENDIDAADLLSKKLAPDMLPLEFQLLCVSHYAKNTVTGFRMGEFRLPPSPKPDYDLKDYAVLMKTIVSNLEQLEESEINDFLDKEIKFTTVGFELTFTAQDFALSFLLPNFYFHVVTAYDILRREGIELGKADFLGKLRLKQ